ncbi:hypothetical protein cypCar_00000644 [Cyprinus carpio]|nr:hypothetical protein cypCar_00000644 [Cyprinus carpio]
MASWALGRCYMTLTTVLHLHWSSSSKCPAGTGKTETVKDLFLLFLCVYVSSVGYACCTELPDDLKSMFQPFFMVVPDSTLIAEITLFPEGFNYCKVHSHAYSV